jgi:glyoxalase family protein
MLELKLSGIHHVTAICGDPQTNIDFYTGVLGLRLVKLTVNFDDPSAYHFYYGDTIGSPGTILTFFNYGAGHRGAAGAGTFVAVTFAVPQGSLDFWKEHLAKYNSESFTNSFGEEIVSATDPDGMTLRFVERDETNARMWTAFGPARSIIRIDGVTLGSRSEASSRFAEERLLGNPEGEKTLSSGNEIKRFRVGASRLDVLPTLHRTMSGPGTIHHVAWRVDDDRAEEFWLAELKKNAVPVSEVRDRDYFHSIYFREPGGALNEIATDVPGFLIDESVETLGTGLRLPAQYRSHRSEIEAALPKLRLPEVPV